VGFELHWAITDRYAGKVLHVNKGERCRSSTRAQRRVPVRHERRARHGVGGSDGKLTTHRMKVGDTLHITPGTRHRITAVEDAEILESRPPSSMTWYGSRTATDALGRDLGV